MTPRTEYDKAKSPAYHDMLRLELHLSQGSVEKSLLNLVKTHVPQINGCAYCIDMHWKDARAAGETEQRLYGLPAWAESPYYTDRERAALAWAEQLTHIAGRHVTDEVYEQVRAQFSEQEIVDLAWAIGAINTWNRVNIALGTVAGTYAAPHAT